MYNNKTIRNIISDCAVEKKKLLLELQDVKNKKVVNINHFVAYDASKNMVIEPSQSGGLEIFKDIDNYPLILQTLGYDGTYEIVGVYMLVPKPKRR